MEITTSEWGTVNGKPATKYTITDPTTGILVEITDFGATLVRVKVPDRDGKVADINYGQNEAETYTKIKGHFGAVTGRVANRIYNAKFTLDNQQFALFVNNNGKHCLHGGKVGFNQKWWKLLSTKVRNEVAELVFQYISPDGEENFPGELNTTVTYRITPNALGWEFAATTTKPTIINITNHAYWNLDGMNTVVDGQMVTMDADEYMPADADCMVTGEIKPVAKGIDLQKGKMLAQSFAEFGDIDNSFFLNGYKTKKNPEDVVFAAELYSPKTGRCMRMYTNEPACQIYTGNFMDGLTYFGGQPAKKHYAICFETQRAPNAINIPKLAESMILRPGQKYFHKTVHVFSLK